jgi:glyoxylase I family protein
MRRVRRPSSKRRRASPRLDHVVLETVDPVAAAAFDRRILGFAEVRLREFLAGDAPFPSVRVNSSTVIDVFPRRMWRDSRAKNPNHLCITVDRPGMAAVKRRLARGGVPITHRDDHNFGARGWGRSIYFNDPDGTSIEVRFYP